MHQIKSFRNVLVFFGLFLLVDFCLLFKYTFVEFYNLFRLTMKFVHLDNSDKYMYVHVVCKFSGKLDTYYKILHADPFTNIQRKTAITNP